MALLRNAPRNAPLGSSEGQWLMTGLLTSRQRIERWVGVTFGASIVTPHLPATGPSCGASNCYCDLFLASGVGIA